MVSWGFSIDLRIKPVIVEMDGIDPGGFRAAIMKTGKIIYIKITNFIAGAVHALKQAAFIIILVLGRLVLLVNDLDGPVVGVGLGFNGFLIRINCLYQRLCDNLLILLDLFLQYFSRLSGIIKLSKIEHLG